MLIDDLFTLSEHESLQSDQVKREIDKDKDYTGNEQAEG